jgi:hypothetical protein
MDKQNQECCPQFDPTPWDDKTFTWDNKRFIKDKVCTLLYMPVNFGSVIRRMNAKIDQAGAKALDWLSLSDHVSPWRMDLLIAVDKEIPTVENITLSGRFLSKVYEGSFKNTGRWRQDYENLAKNRNLVIKREYMWYTTCPKCAKKYGKNYVVIIGKIE